MLHLTIGRLLRSRATRAARLEQRAVRHRAPPEPRPQPDRHDAAERLRGGGARPARRPHAPSRRPRTTLRSSCFEAGLELLDDAATGSRTTHCVSSCTSKRPKATTCAATSTRRAAARPGCSNALRDADRPRARPSGCAACSTRTCRATRDALASTRAGLALFDLVAARGGRRQAARRSEREIDRHRRRCCGDRDDRGAGRAAG